VTVPKSDLWSDEKAEAWERAEENYRPSLGWLGEVFSCPEVLQFSPNMLTTFECISMMCVIRSERLKLLPTAKVGDNKCLICSVWSILPMLTRGDSDGWRIVKC
jgi:hypothetical protein